jgi:hypothetical protein
MFRSTFVIEIVEGEARVRRGNPPAGFASACTDIARLHGVRSGRIEGVGQGRHARLRFSSGIPERARQPFRNVWTPPPAPRPGGRRARG